MLLRTGALLPQQLQDRKVAEAGGEATSSCNALHGFLRRLRVRPCPLGLPISPADSCSSHSSEQLTAAFPSFVVIVRADPSLGPRDGEILLGGPILKRKHCIIKKTKTKTKTNKKPTLIIGYFNRTSFHLGRNLLFFLFS